METFAGRCCLAITFFILICFKLRVKAWIFLNMYTLYLQSVISSFSLPWKNTHIEQTGNVTFCLDSRQFPDGRPSRIGIIKEKHTFSIKLGNNMNIISSLIGIDSKSYTDLLNKYELQYTWIKIKSVTKWTCELQENQLLDKRSVRYTLCEE